MIDRNLGLRRAGARRGSAALALALAAFAAALIGCGAPGQGPDGGAEGGAEGGVDPCRGVPRAGRCMSTTGYEYCLVTTEGSNDTRVVTETCEQGETCQVTDGRARCVTAGECRDGQSACADAHTLRTCAGGRWSTMACPEACESGPAQAECVATAGTTMLSGRFVFERRSALPAERPTDWGPVEDAPGRGFLVSVLRGTTLVGSATTSVEDASAGQFTVRAPQAPAPGDALVVSALLRDGDGALRVVAADQGTPAGMHPVGPPAEGAATRVWSWRFDLTAAPADGVYRVREDEGSGVASVFDGHGVAYRSALAHYQRPAAPIVIWMGRGVQWDCGACVAPDSVAAFGARFDQQEWYGYDADLSVYSAAVIGHEAGHWIMEAYGRSPGEGGGHSAEHPAFPGLAWSDGWATGYSSLLRRDPLYVDKQSGTMFWSNLATRMATSPRPRPSPAASDVMPSEVPGLLQRMGEEEVSAILWLLGDGGARLGAMYDALASPRMRVLTPAGLFERGYRRHTYDYVAQTGAYTNVLDTGEAAPTLPDFLDALVCAGFPRDAIDRATEPATHYPYPSDRPRCRP